MVYNCRFEDEILAEITVTQNDDNISTNNYDVLHFFSLFFFVYILMTLFFYPLNCGLVTFILAIILATMVLLGRAANQDVNHTCAETPSQTNFMPTKPGQLIFTVGQYIYLTFTANLIGSTLPIALFFQPPKKEWLRLHLTTCYCRLVVQLSREENSMLLFLGAHCPRFVTETRKGWRPRFPSLTRFNALTMLCSY